MAVGLPSSLDLELQDGPPVAYKLSAHTGQVGPPMVVPKDGSAVRLPMLTAARLAVSSIPASFPTPAFVPFPFDAIQAGVVLPSSAAVPTALVEAKTNVHITAPSVVAVGPSGPTCLVLPTAVVKPAVVDDVVPFRPRLTAAVAVGEDPLLGRVAVAPHAIDVRQVVGRRGFTVPCPRRRPSVLVEPYAVPLEVVIFPVGPASSEMGATVEIQVDVDISGPAFLDVGPLRQTESSVPI